MITTMVVIGLIFVLVVLVAWYEGKVAMKVSDCQYWYCDTCHDLNDIHIQECSYCGNKRG